MLDPDISAKDAKALLSISGDAALLTPEGLNRRRFLQMVGLGIGGGALIGNIMPGLLPGDWREAFGAPLGPTDGILVLIGLYGGNDGLNTVVPYSNPKYQDYRANIAIPTAQLHVLDNNFGLHPNLNYVKALYDQQQVAIVQGIGYPNADLSHFNSMGYWMAGRTTGSLSSGWIGRWLDGIGSKADLYTAASIGNSLPLHLVGQTTKGTAVPPWGFDFGGRTDNPALRMYDGIRAYSASSAGRGPWHDSLAGSSRGQIDLAQSVAPIFEPEITTDDLVRSLTVAARLINADMGFRVLDTSLDGFDHHDNEPTGHADMMQRLDDGIKAFYATLSPQFANRVTLMTFSEFGRTPWSNDSLGTDHGTSAPHFVIGGNVQGGLYGQQSSLVDSGGAPLDRWERLDYTMDFRSLYATMIDGVLGGGASTVLGGNYEKIPLFRAAPVTTPGTTPGTDPPTGGTTPGTDPMSGAAGTDLVSIVPVRLLDTREGTGAPIGPAASITLAVAGVHAVPGTAVAAVLNVTAVGATSASYITVWPTGTDRPGTSSLNVRGGDVVPNLVIAKLGNGGSIDIYNNGGNVHCVVDIVGYFQHETASRFTSLAPARILDTRSGQGAPAGGVGQDQFIDLQVAGQGGVSNDADTVVLNVTVTEPSGEGFVTVWPTGSAMPTASNLNFVPGQTVPNLVIAKLGSGMGGGRVSLYNSSGTSHLIADVLGYFRSGTGARLTSLSPARLLDTRSDGGSSNPVGQTPLVLPVVGRGGVPASGVSAVVLNVTATDGTSNGYVTVYPSGQDAPTASNLNTLAGQTRANLVIAKVGADGAVALFNSGGTIHLLADVVGYFTG
jgi:uncharacterized protein (DUF1501 family)